MSPSFQPGDQIPFTMVIDQVCLEPYPALEGRKAGLPTYPDLASRGLGLILLLRLTIGQLLVRWLSLTEIAHILLVSP